ncbi:MAG: DUF6805 domain-containing protein, partial [Flavobacterium sp.]
DLGNMRFKLDSLELEPFFQVHDARYQMYFQTYTKEDYKEKQALLKQQEIEAMAIEAKTVDKINFGEQQPEVDHHYKGEKSDSGYDDGRFWRNTSSYISYQMINKNGAGKFIEISFLGDYKLDNLEVLINEKPVEIISNSDKLIRFNVDTSEVFNLKIKSKDGHPTSKLYQIRIVK